MVFYIYQDRQSFWRWHLKAANGKVVADSGEGYSTKLACQQGILLVKSATNAPVYQYQS